MTKQTVSKTELLNMKIAPAPLVSVIIPVYNVESYLVRCLDSVLVQTYKNLEIILVDDGSKDKSGQICDEYAKRDNRVKVIHQTNRGQSAARNAGVQSATGEYIAFVDSDDEVVPEYIGVMLGAALTLKSDVVQTWIKIVKVGASCQLTNQENIEELSYEPGKYAANDMRFKVSPCAKLFRTYIVKNNPFPHYGANEDDAVYYRFAYDAKKICILDYYTYYYYQTDHSVMRNSEKKDAQTEYIPIYYDRIGYFIQRNEQKLVEGSRNRFCLIVMLNYAAYKKTGTNKKDLSRLLRIFREQYCFIRESKELVGSRKLMYWAFYYFPNVSAKMIGLLRK